MKRIISTILTISMLFTMIPAFASDIETSDVNNTMQLFSAGNGEAVIKKSADQLAMNVADFEEQEVGQLTIADGKTYNGTNFQLYSKPNGGTETYSIVEADGNKYLKMDNAAGGYTGNSGSIVKQNLANGKKVALSFRMKFDLPATDWLSININADSGIMSGSYLDHSGFGFNYGGDYSEANNPAAFAKYKGAVNKIFNVETNVWYTFNYLFDLEKQTYDFSVTSDKGDVEILLTTKDGSDPLKDVPFRGRKNPSTKPSDIVMYVPHNSKSAPDTVANSFSVDDIVSYAVQEGVFFNLIGPETLSDDADIRIEYNNTTADDKDVCVTYVAFEDGVVVDIAEDIVTLATDKNSEDVDVSVDTADCTGEVTYAAFVTDVETGATLCTKGSKEGTSAPADFVTASEANGQLVVNIAKDVAYDAAIIRVWDEDGNLVGIKEQKVTTSDVKFDIKNYNQEYTADVILSDAAGNYAQDSDSIIAWNPTIAEDFNNDPEEAFIVHMDALEKAHPGFEEIFSENEDYIIEFIMMREDYTSVYDVVETVLSLQGFLEVMGAESEAAFARALENNADSLGIVIDNIYWNNKDAIIAKLYADKENDAFIISEELVEAYNNAYVVAEFNAAPAISYGRLFKKYADVLEIVVDKTYTNGEATINELIFAAKEENGGFEDMKAIAVAFKLAKNNAENPIGYETIAKSPVSKEEALVNFEEDTAAYTVGIKTGMEAYGSYEVVEEDDNKYLRMVQTAGGEDAVQFTAKELPYSGIVNVSEKIKFESLDKGYTLLRIMGVYLYIENYKWGMNYGGGTMDTAGTIESVKTGVWYNINIELNFDGKTNNDKTFEATIYDENGNLVFEDSGSFRPSASEEDYKSIVVVTPHRDDRDGKVNLTEDDTIVCVDDIRVAVKPAPAVYYSAKALNGVVAGSNGMAVAVENLTGEDRAMGVYVPVYVDGVLYTMAFARDYFMNGAEKELIVDYVLPADVDTSKVTYSVIVADGFDGVNHSVVSATTAGVLSVDATADFEKDIINVTTDSTFDNGTIIVLAPGATLANAIPEDILYYGTGMNATVKVADGVMGELKVYAIAQNMDGEVTKVNENVYYPGNGAAAELVADFADISGDNVANVVAKHMSLINAIEPGIVTFYNENAVEVNEALVANKPYTSTEQIINTIKSVKALKALEAASSEAEFETAFEEFVEMFDVKLDSIYDNNKATFISVLFEAKDTFDTYEDVMDAYDAIYMVFDINTATENTIGNMLVKYADDLGITLDNVYTAKKLYIDRIVAKGLPFANVEAVVAAYNDAYTKALNIEGDFSYGFVDGSEVLIKAIDYDFENLEPISGNTSYKFEETGKGSFTLSATSGGSYAIVENDGNKMIRLEQLAESEDAAVAELKIPTGVITKSSYRLMFEKLDSGYVMLAYGGAAGASIFYIQNGKFGINFGGGKMDTSGCKENVQTNVWYDVTFTVNSAIKKYDVLVKRDNVVVFEHNNADFRGTGLDVIRFVTPHVDGEGKTTSADTIMYIDNVSARSYDKDVIYYSVYGSKNMLDGNNKYDVSFTHTYDVPKPIYIYMPVYINGILVDIAKVGSNNVEDYVKPYVNYTSRLNAYITEADFANANEITYDVIMVGALDGVNYNVKSESKLPRTTTPNTPVVDYSKGTITVSGKTTNDNLMLLVTGPRDDVTDWSIEAAIENRRLIAYYAPVELAEIDSTKDPETKEKICTYSFSQVVDISNIFKNGDYRIYLISQNSAGEVMKVEQTAYYPGYYMMKDMLAGFNGVSDINDVAAVVSEYLNVLNEIDSNIVAFYNTGNNSAEINQSILENAGNYTSSGEIIDTFLSVYATHAMVNSGDVATLTNVLETYSRVLGLEIATSEYAAGKAEISNRLFNDRANITKDNLKAKFEDALMLSEFNNATRDEVPAVLNKYAAKLNITVDDTYIDFIKKTIAADGLVFNSAQDVINAYNTGVTLGQSSAANDTPTQSAPTGAPSGGGGGGGGAAPQKDKVFFEEPYVESEKTVDGESVNAVAFNDLDTVSWAVESITALKKIGVINGVSETEFAPNREVTREEFAKMIVNAFSITGEGKSFADVPATAWYAPYVTALASSGIVNGLSDTTFGVGAKITRQDAAVILDRTAINANINYENRKSAVDIFSDYIADYAVDSIYRLYQNKVISGTSATTFSATATLTRAQAAKMIYSLMQLK